MATIGKTWKRPQGNHCHVTGTIQPPHVAHLMTFPCLEAYHMTKLFGAGKVGGGWGTKHVVSVPPSTPRSAAIFLPAAARNVLPQSHTPLLCSRNGFNPKGDLTGGSMGLVALVGRWVDRGGSQCSCSARVPPTSGPCHTGYRGAVQRWRPHRKTQRGQRLRLVGSGEGQPSLLQHLLLHTHTGPATT